MSATEPRGVSTRDRIVRAAIEIAAQEDLAAATTSAIARRAGVAEGTLYRHYATKDDLLIAAYRQVKAEVFIDAAASVDAGALPPARLAATWKAIYEAYRRDPAAFQFGQRFAESALEEREAGEATRSIARMLADLRRAGIASGHFRQLPVDLLANLFLAPISYLMKFELKGRRWTDDELDAAVRSVLAGWSV
jgi:AcrR family transcriptional regulator